MAKTLTLTDKQARDIYPTAAPELKTILESSFSKEFFSQKITDRVKTFEDACNVLGVTPSFTSIDTSDEIAYKKLKIIVRALNEGWQPNWNNSGEYKHYPWFYMDPKRGFVLYYVYCNLTYSSVGSRLCFRSEELAQYAATQFVDLYKQLFTL